MKEGHIVTGVINTNIIDPKNLIGTHPKKLGHYGFDTSYGTVWNQLDLNTRFAQWSQKLVISLKSN